MTQLITFQSRRHRKREHLAMRASKQTILAEYAAAGLAPVYADGFAETVLSLSLLLSLGWRIEEMQERNVLIRPERPAKREEDDA